MRAHSDHSNKIIEEIFVEIHVTDYDLGLTLDLAQDLDLDLDPHHSHSHTQSHSSEVYYRTCHSDLVVAAALDLLGVPQALEV